MLALDCKLDFISDITPLLVNYDLKFDQILNSFNDCFKV